MTSTIYYAIKGMPQVLGWLGKDTYWPCAVPRAEMDTLIGVTAAMEAGTNPREWLKNVDIRTRQRRGYGTLTIQGKSYTVPFNLEDKQPEDPQGDASPAEDKGE